MSPQNMEFAELVRVLRMRGCKWSLRKMKILLGLRIPYATLESNTAAANDRPRPRLLAKV